MLRPIEQRSSDRHGLTIIEVLVVLGIIALLVALILAAIQRSREASRKLQCANNLRQLGQALAQFESAHGRYPYLWENGQVNLVNLLPYLDQKALYDVALQEEESGVPTYERTLFSTKLSVLCCPSDPAAALESPYTATSYRENGGNGVHWYGFNGLFVPLDGEFFGYPESIQVRAADVTDGLSNTAAFCEGFTSDGSDERLRVMWALPPNVLDENEVRQQCLAQPEAGGYAFVLKWALGRPWAGDSWTFYTHSLPPNSPSCSLYQSTWAGPRSAGSLHNGGAHVVFGDGHLEFTSETVDTEVWREFGSRSSDVLLP